MREYLGMDMLVGWLVKDVGWGYIKVFYIKDM
jgi:hypothetical protein